MGANLIYIIAIITILLIVAACAIVFILINLCSRYMDNSNKAQEEMYKWIKSAIEHDKTN